MSKQLIDHSGDLSRLRDDGYDLEIRSSHLAVKGIPYVNQNKEIRYGILVSALQLAGDRTDKPNTHVAFFIGEYPCHQNGERIRQLEHGGRTELDKGWFADWSFSNKPQEGFVDYHEKMTSYANIISAPAQAIDPNVTAATPTSVEAADDESVFQYPDTSSTRAGILAISRRLELAKVAIAGVGGTGSYVLDLVAKTPVKEIHIYDGDMFLNHNAFRSPGAASLEELRERPTKAAYLKAQYSKMHRHVIAHDAYIDESNVEELGSMDFVFICLDRGHTKKLLVETLEARSVPFIDVGMGVGVDHKEQIDCILRVTTSTSTHRGHVRANGRITFTDGDGNNDYGRNIQIADLNALNAALAVIRWKKLFGFYRDLGDEYFSAYTSDGNSLINEDQQEPPIGSQA